MVSGAKGGGGAAQRLQDALEEFQERWAGGETLDLEEYCERHSNLGPQLRDEIEDFLFTAEGLREMLQGPQGRQSGSEDLGTEPAAGAKLGDFRILREIGRGGMGVVYEAEQISLRRVVALKVLPAHLTLRRQAVERFRREASTTARLRHVGIIEVHSVGEHGGTHYFAMSFVEGAPLDCVVEALRDRSDREIDGETIRKIVMRVAHRRTVTAVDDEAEVAARPADPSAWRGSTSAVVARIFLQVADALEHAHRAGVLHRDVKPSNVLVRTDGTVVLTDFGLARECGLPSLSMTGEFAGTPYYVSPEQAQPRGRQVDARSDVFSLGIALYELLTRERPFDGETTRDVLDKILSTAVPLRPRRIDARIPRDLETICLTSIDKDPERRYQSASELAEDLRRFLDGRPVHARPVGHVTRAVRGMQRNPLLTTVVALVIAFLLTLTIIQRSNALHRERQINNLQRQRELTDQILTTLTTGFGFAQAAPYEPLDAGLSKMGPRNRGKLLTADAALDHFIEILGAERASVGISMVEPWGTEGVFLLRRTAGSICRLRGDYEQALEELDEALKLADLPYGHHSPERISCELQLALVHHDLGTIDEGDADRDRQANLSLARKYYEAAIRNCEGRSEDSGLTSGELLGTLAAARNGYAVLQRDLGDLHRYRARELERLGDVDRGRRERKQAEELYEAADRLFELSLAARTHSGDPAPFPSPSTRLQQALLRHNMLHDIACSGRLTKADLEERIARIEPLLEPEDDGRARPAPREGPPFSFPLADALHHSLEMLRKDVDGAVESPPAAVGEHIERPPLYYVERGMESSGMLCSFLALLSPGESRGIVVSGKLEDCQVCLGAGAFHDGRLLVVQDEIEGLEGGAAVAASRLMIFPDGGAGDPVQVFGGPTVLIKQATWHPGGERIYFAMQKRKGAPEDWRSDWGIYTISASPEIGEEPVAVLYREGQTFEHPGLRTVGDRVEMCYLHYPWHSGANARELWIATLDVGGTGTRDSRALTSDSISDWHCTFDPSGGRVFWNGQWTTRKFGEGGPAFLFETELADGAESGGEVERRMVVPMPRSFEAFSVGRGGVLAAEVLQGEVRLLELYALSGEHILTLEGPERGGVRYELLSPCFAD